MTDTSPFERKLSARAALRAIEELKRRGKTEWGVSYYSQVAPQELCHVAGRQRQVQYGALISWLKRLGEGSRAAPSGALELVAHLTGAAPGDASLTTEIPVAGSSSARKLRGKRVSEPRNGLKVNCPSVVHDYRFVVVGELPDERLHAAVLVRPFDGRDDWYPQVARHNPLRAGRCFACFVQLGNPVGIWHVKRPPLDATVRVLSLEKAWSPDASARISDDELTHMVAQLGVVEQQDSRTSRVSTNPLKPSLRDGGLFEQTPLAFDEPRATSCVAPVLLDWSGGAAFIEIRAGNGDALLFEGTAAPGAMLTLRGRERAPGTEASFFEFPEPGRYRVRLYPAFKSFVDPPYEWWLDVR